MSRKWLANDFIYQSSRNILGVAQRSFSKTADVKQLWDLWQEAIVRLSVTWAWQCGRLARGTIFTYVVDVAIWNINLRRWSYHTFLLSARWSDAQHQL